MNCPNCNIALMMTERKGIEIDFCTQCRGVWLDRGELDKIIEISTKELTASIKESAPQRDAVRPSKSDRSRQYSRERDDHRDRDRYRDDDRGKYRDRDRYKKPKSTLEQLFDLFD